MTTDELTRYGKSMDGYMEPEEHGLWVQAADAYSALEAMQATITVREAQSAHWQAIAEHAQTERDAYQQAADKMAAEHKAERDALQAKLEPLTDEQIEQAVKNSNVTWTGYREDKHGFYTIPVLSPYHYDFARAIEAAHGIGGQSTC